MEPIILEVPANVLPGIAWDAIEFMPGIVQTYGYPITAVFFISKSIGAN